MVLIQLSSFVSATGSQQFSRDALTAHNRIRRLHGVDPLILNSEICRIAQAYADKLAYYVMPLEPSSSTYNKSRLGENLALSYGNADYTGS